MNVIQKRKPARDSSPTLKLRKMEKVLETKRPSITSIFNQQGLFDEKRETPRETKSFVSHPGLPNSANDLNSNQEKLYDSHILKSKLLILDSTLDPNL